jgi:hypothetical protein
MVRPLARVISIGIRRLSCWCRRCCRERCATDELYHSARPPRRNSSTARRVSGLGPLRLGVQSESELAPELQVHAAAGHGRRYRLLPQHLGDFPTRDARRDPVVRPKLDPYFMRLFSWTTRFTLKSL